PNAGARSTAWCRPRCRTTRTPAPSRRPPRRPARGTGRRSPGCARTDRSRRGRRVRPGSHGAVPAWPVSAGGTGDRSRRRPQPGDDLLGDHVEPVRRTAGDEHRPGRAGGRERVEVDPERRGRPRPDPGLQAARAPPVEQASYLLVVATDDDDPPPRRRDRPLPRSLAQQPHLAGELLDPPPPAVPCV